MAHQFHLGQLVRRAGQIGAPARREVYEIVSVVPDETGAPRYRIKGIGPETHEVSERELVAASRALATATKTLTA
ncbi:hypothetical protein [Methylobacterium nigriterrae]|uniref:hypothetical protein n=1 Tax=Methylobacterium nigriterrae TaxID=3127512 RepID=UPI00301374AD